MTAARVRIIEGAAGCGKTALALDAYRRCVAEHGFDAALVLVPTGRVGDLVRGRLWHEGLSGLFDFRVLTFAGLADALLLANHVPVAAVNDLQQQYLVGRAVAEMSDAELGPLAAQRDRPGLIASVAGLINEMKAAGVSPEALGDALARGGADAIERAGVRAYARYQKLLQERNLYDAAGMLWQAQEALAEGKARPFERTRLVIADGFSDFTTTQLRVLARLAEIAEETIITLTCEPGEDRPELQRVPARTRAALEAHLGGLGPIERVTPACPESADTDLGYLRAHLFDATAQPRDVRDETVRVLRAPGLWAEVRLAAREIKRLLTRKDGAARPTDIAIVTRSLDAYQGALRGVFDEYDLPLFVAGGEPSARRACVRLAADLLRLVEEDFPRVATVSVLDSTYLRVAEDSPLLMATAADVDEVARKAGIVGGRDLWMKALDRLAVRTERRVRHAEEAAAEESEPEDEEERAPSAEEARALVDGIARVKASFGALAEMLAPLARADSRRGFVGALLTVPEPSLAWARASSRSWMGRHGAAELRGVERAGRCARKTRRCRRSARRGRGRGCRLRG